MQQRKTETKNRFLSIKQQYSTQCLISGGLLLLGIAGVSISNFAIGSAYLGFIVGCIFFLAAIVFQVVITVKAAPRIEKDTMELSQRQELRKFAFRTSALIIGSAIVLAVACIPLITLPWMFSQKLILVGWLEEGWKPALITLCVCAYVAWFLDITAMGKRYWVRKKLSKQERNIRNRYMLVSTALLLSVFLIQLLFNCISLDALAGGHTFETWDDYRDFMELPRDEWGNTVDRSLDRTEQVYAYDDETLLCEYTPLNFSIHHTEYSIEKDLLPVTVYTNRQVKDAERLQSNVNVLLISLYILIAIGTPAVYFWKKRK